MPRRGRLPLLCSALLLLGCSHEEPAGGAADAVADTGAAKDADAWLDAAREASRVPRATSFRLVTGSAAAQEGEILYLDATRFLVTAHTEVTLSMPDGPSESSAVTMRIGADGEELRILLPPAFGGRATMAVLPVARIPDLASATTPFRIELLEPMHLVQGLLSRLESAGFHELTADDGSKRILVEGVLPAGSLADLGLGSTDVVDSGARTEVLLDRATATVFALELFPSEFGEHGLTLSLPDLGQPSEMEAADLRLELPEGTATMDLSRLLPTEES